MFEWPLLSIVIFSPILGAIAIATVGGSIKVVRRNSRYSALFTTAISFIFSILLLIKFDTYDAGVQLENKVNILPPFFINFTVGVDGISLFFILMTAFISMLTVIATWSTYTPKIKEFMIAFLVLETMVLGAFSAQNLILFFLFIEGTLFPIFMMIGVWGGRQSRLSAFRFALTSMIGSMLMFPAVLMIVFRAGTGYMPDLLTMEFSGDILSFIWWVLFLGFAIKIPIVPFHSWYSHVLNNASIPVTAFIIGVLTKLGVYGMLRVNILMFPYASSDFADIVIFITLFSAVYSVAVAIVSDELKRTVGYLSMAAINISVSSLFLLTDRSVSGAIFSLISYSLATTGMMMIISILLNRFKTTNIGELRGIYSITPRISAAFFLMAVTLAGMPFTSGFSTMIILLTGVLRDLPPQGLAVAILIVVIGVTALNIHHNIFWGKPNTFILNKGKIKDTQPWETTLLVLLSVIIIWIGVTPNVFIQPIEQAVWGLLSGFTNTGGGINAIFRDFT